MPRPYEGKTFNVAGKKGNQNACLGPTGKDQRRWAGGAGPI